MRVTYKGEKMRRYYPINLFEGVFQTLDSSENGAEGDFWLELIPHRRGWVKIHSIYRQAGSEETAAWTSHKYVRVRKDGRMAGVIINDGRVWCKVDGRLFPDGRIELSFWWAAVPSSPKADKPQQEEASAPMSEVVGKKRKSPSKRKSSIKCGWCKEEGHHNARTCKKAKKDESPLSSLAAAAGAAAAAAESEDEMTDSESESGEESE